MIMKMRGETEKETHADNIMKLVAFQRVNSVLSSGSELVLTCERL